MADPTQTQITQTTIPDYAKPYVESMLGQGQALTDLNQNPYMQYQGERIAQFTPLQQQAFENAGLMQTAPQLQDATALAGQAGLGALNTQYTFTPSNFTGETAKNMMNPYLDIGYMIIRNFQTWHHYRQPALFHRCLLSIHHRLRLDFRCSYSYSHTHTLPFKSP